jgi:HEAT repeat protein
MNGSTWRRRLALCLLVMAGVLAAGEGGGDGEGAERGVNEKTTVETWRDILRFGIDTEVLGVIKAVEESGERSLDTEIRAFLSGAQSRELRIAALEYLTRRSDPGAEGQALELLAAEEDAALANALIRYVREIRSARAAPLLEEMLDRPGGGVARAAIQALGKIGGEGEGRRLLARLENPDCPQELKPELILALGELRLAAAVQPLIGIAASRDSEKTWRMYACDSLGKIADERAIPTLETLFSEEDALLRAYAASALARFDMQKVLDRLVQGLRDSNVRVRLAAAKGLATAKAARAVEILEYKAANDPEWQVRVQAIQSLGEIGDAEAVSYICAVLLDEKASLLIRQTALDSLLAGHLGQALDPLRALFEREGESGQPKLLEYAAQKLSQLQDERLEAFFLRFLESKNYLLRIYGIRGLAGDGLRAHRDRLEAISRDDPHPSVRKTAGLMLGRLESPSN